MHRSERLAEPPPLLPPPGGERFCRVGKVARLPPTVLCTTALYFLSPTGGLCSAALQAVSAAPRRAVPALSQLVHPVAVLFSASMSVQRHEAASMCPHCSAEEETKVEALAGGKW